jgi:glyoxylase-like metal-dependent hydrolase (beta-lactamase superfamily II)
MLAGSGVMVVAGGTTATAQPAPDRESDGRRDRVRVSVGFVIGQPTITEDSGLLRVGVPMLSDGRSTIVDTQPVNEDVAEVIAGSLAEGALVDYLISGHEVVVFDEPSETFHTVLTKGADPVFVMRKYGPELARRGGEPGAMVAAGWVYAKEHRTITIGDGRVVTEDISGRALPRPSRRYEETYTLAEDVEVYEANTQDWGASTPSSFRAIPVTRDYAYSTRNRQAAFVVFDRNFLHVAAARVRQIFYFTPQDVSDGKPVWDVPTQSDILAGKGIDPVSGLPFVDIVATGVASAPYTRSTEPFEIVPGTFYCVGDNEVALYLFRCDMGTGSRRDDRLVLLDTGWPNSGYQYWKNIEAVGVDPRNIDCILMSHGHGDHYGTTVELVSMIENAGGEVELISPRADVLGIQTDAVGNVWNLSGDLPVGERLIRERTRFFEYDTWMNFGNVRIRPMWTPGHTAGTTSFVFEVRHNGRRLTFGYMGGYGWNNANATPTNGWRRLGFAYNLAWLQQTVDVDFVTGQHTNQYPIIEVYQALKAYNNDPANRTRQLTMLDALTRGEWVNYLEKRYQVANRSIEALGPPKPGRAAGVRDVRVRLVDGGQVVHGFQKNQNINPRLPLLRNGVVIGVDSSVHDPTGWYVQFELTVLDSYGGYLPGVGPVESIRSEASEVLRTQRFDTRARADAVARSVRAGRTYRVDLTPSSAIAVPDDGSPVLRADQH